MYVTESPFDSQHYDLRIGHLLFEALDELDELEPTVSRARSLGYDVLFARLDEAHPLREALERRGYRPVDTLITSRLGARRPVGGASREVAIEHHVRLHGKEDVAAIATITATSITTSHLHADPRLPVERTRALYAAWATNDVEGRAQRTLVARTGKQVVGYIAVLERPNAMIIDLVAVDPQWRGRGVGSALLQAFTSYVEDRSTSATVGTQANNPALRLYARAGFVPIATHLSYHVWLS